MLDLKFIRDNLDAVRSNCERRRISIDFDRFLKLEEARKQAIYEVEDIRKQQNEIAQAMKAKLSPDERTTFINKGKELKTVEAEGTAKLTALESELEAICRAIPNMT
ncbi:MAG: serine--tRNA ligase, partial [Deltaproteobacteria bacterium]|nr:serine--tRNA ligase [Deltaproteobacteria bacterium]